MPSNKVEQAIPKGAVSALLHVLTALSDAQTSAARMAELEADALERALGITGGSEWPNAAQAADSVDTLRGKLAGVVDPLACALCCVTNMLSADGCAKPK
ncbi:MAG: hypothetical protein LBS11_00105 [Oscillospiraceae bacterium]|nr:hypothetical protein [Oscillospiraceae bacterium]